MSATDRAAAPSQCPITRASVGICANSDSPGQGRDARSRLAIGARAAFLLLPHTRESFVAALGSLQVSQRLEIAPVSGGLTPSPELMASSEIRALDWDGQTGRHIDAGNGPRVAACPPKSPCSSGFPPEADGGTRTPDPIITSQPIAPHVRLPVRRPAHESPAPGRKPIGRTQARVRTGCQAEGPRKDPQPLVAPVSSSSCGVPGYQRRALRPSHACLADRDPGATNSDPTAPPLRRANPEAPPGGPPPPKAPPPEGGRACQTCSLPQGHRRAAACGRP
jgi:hypothetical protein